MQRGSLRVVWVEYWWAEARREGRAPQGQYHLSVKGTRMWWPPGSMTTRQHWELSKAEAARSNRRPSPRKYPSNSDRECARRTPFTRMGLRPTRVSVDDSALTRQDSKFKAWSVKDHVKIQELVPGLLQTAVNVALRRRPSLVGLVE